ncbi:unnamed protein product, partial [Prorocentrum cordatum]
FFPPEALPSAVAAMLAGGRPAAWARAARARAPTPGGQGGGRGGGGGGGGGGEGAGGGRGSRERRSTLGARSASRGCATARADRGLQHVLPRAAAEEHVKQGEKSTAGACGRHLKQGPAPARLQQPSGDLVASPVLYTRRWAIARAHPGFGGESAPGAVPARAPTWAARGLPAGARSPGTPRGHPPRGARPGSPEVPASTPPWGTPKAPAKISTRRPLCPGSPRFRASPQTFSQPGSAAHGRRTCAE